MVEASLIVEAAPNIAAIINPEHNLFVEGLAAVSMGAIAQAPAEVLVWMPPESLSRRTRDSGASQFWDRTDVMDSVDNFVISPFFR